MESLQEIPAALPPPRVVLMWVPHVLLQVLPTARHPDQHISPFAAPLTDPLAVPLGRLLRLPPWVAVLLLLVADAAALAVLGRIG